MIHDVVRALRCAVCWIRWRDNVGVRVGRIVEDDHQSQCVGADFCQEFDGLPEVTFSRIYGGRPPSRVIMTIGDFTVLADLSPLVVGHVLLLPKQHFLSFAQVSASTPMDLRRAVTIVVDLYRETFGSPVILEHGSAANDDHSACVTHAHWHLVPLSGCDVAGLMCRDGLRPTAVSDLGSAPWLDASYYLVGQNGSFHVCAARNMPKQYVRSLIGRCLGMRDPDWDYALIVRRELLRDTMELTAGWRRRCMRERP